MSLNNYRTLGNSGLVVSPLALGTMTFGTDNWGADKETSKQIFNAYINEGGNFVDTADIYSGGLSEQMVGEFISSAKLRDRVVVSTKFAFNNSSSPLLANQKGAGNPNEGGTGAKNIHRALNESLKRLQTDYIDLYWMHIWDGVTPVEEVVQTLGDLVRSGKIRYYAFSDMPAWFAMKAATIASERRIPGPIAMQFEYSLVARDIETEHVPVAREAQMGIMPWSPLAGGFLSGKYTREKIETSGRLNKPNPFGQSKFTEKNWLILDEVRRISSELNCSPSQVSLAWVMNQKYVSSTLIGARDLKQLKDNLFSNQIKLSPESILALNTISDIPASFTNSLASKDIRKMVFGGNDVKSWQE